VFKPIWPFLVEPGEFVFICFASLKTLSEPSATNAELQSAIVVVGGLVP
jgi:hypothetical protein